MCVVVAPAVAWAMAAASAAAAVASGIEQNKKAQKQAELLRQAADKRADQLADQASAEMNVRAKQVRAARASARANAGGAGINLGSGSFLAQLDAFDAQLDEAQGLQSKNLKNAIDNNDSTLNVSLSQLNFKSGLNIAMDAAQAGASTYSSAGGSFVQKPSGT